MHQTTTFWNPYDRTNNLTLFSEKSEHVSILDSCVTPKVNGNHLGNVNCHSMWHTWKILLMVLLNSVQSLTVLTFCAQWMGLAALLERKHQMSQFTWHFNSSCQKLCQIHRGVWISSVSHINTKDERMTPASRGSPDQSVQPKKKKKMGLGAVFHLIRGTVRSGSGSKNRITSGQEWGSFHLVG